ncbi:hypothetical protein AgCh_030824 [Apium graveolens]
MSNGLRSGIVRGFKITTTENNLALKESLVDELTQELDVRKASEAQLKLNEEVCAKELLEVSLKNQESEVLMLKEEFRKITTEKEAPEAALADLNSNLAQMRNNSSKIIRIIEQYLFVRDGGIETGDCFRFFQPDSHRTSTSLRYVYDKFKDLKRSCDVRSSDCQTVKPAYSEQNKIFGALIFSCISRGKPLGEANVACSLFLENFPDVTLAGSFCSGEICRGDSSSYGQLSERAGSQRCCVHYYSSVYLVMSYTPSLLGI